MERQVLAQDGVSQRLTMFVVDVVAAAVVVPALAAMPVLCSVAVTEAPHPVVASAAVALQRKG